MPLQNRVLPTGEIVADAARGLFTGNRGILHDEQGHLGTSRWQHPHWVLCTLDHPRGVYHGPMPHRGWTALFFLDEAVGLAAGHRPCHYCRRATARAFVEAFQAAQGAATDRLTMDRTLHRARVTRQRTQVRFQASLQDMPDGSFVLWKDQPMLVQPDHLLPYATGGYGPPLSRPQGTVTVLTPAPSVAALRSGYAPVLHPSASLP